MTHTRFGLTSRTLREAVADRILSPRGYDPDRILADEEIGRFLQISLSDKGWRIYDGGRQGSVSITQDDLGSTTNRQQLIDEVARTAFPIWRIDVAEHMRRRSLRDAGLGEYDAAPAWSLLVHPLMLSVGAATGLPPSRLALMRSERDGLPRFADLLDGEEIGSTDLYHRPDGCERDYLKANDSGQPWWTLQHTLQLLADEDFPIRSIVVRTHRTTVEMRHAVPETQMQGLVGVHVGRFIELAGIEPGTPGGDLPIQAATQSGMWNRLSFDLPTIFGAAGPAPRGIDMRWVELFGLADPIGGDPVGPP